MPFSPFLSAQGVMKITSSLRRIHQAQFQGSNNLDERLVLCMAFYRIILSFVREKSQVLVLKISEVHFFLGCPDDPKLAVTDGDETSLAKFHDFLSDCRVLHVF